MNGSVALASDPRGAGHTARDAAAAASDACGLLPSLCWPLARLGVALDTLADASGLAAPTGSPSAHIRAARATPHNRGSRCVPAAPGMMPNFTSGWPT